MKIQLFAFCYLLSISLYSQDSLNSPLSIAEVVKVDSSLKMSELYQRAYSWFAVTYKSSKDVIQLNDKEGGKIVGKCVIKYNSGVFSGSEKTDGWINYTISIQVKDGRYKYELEDFIHTGKGISFDLITNDEPDIKIFGAGQGWKNKVWNDIKIQIRENTTPLINSLKSAMSKPASDSDNNW